MLDVPTESASLREMAPSAGQSAGPSRNGSVSRSVCGSIVGPSHAVQGSVPREYVAP